MKSVSTSVSPITILILASLSPSCSDSDNSGGNGPASGGSTTTAGRGAGGNPSTGGSTFGGSASATGGGPSSTGGASSMTTGGAVVNAGGSGLGGSTSSGGSVPAAGASTNGGAATSGGTPATAGTATAGAGAANGGTAGGAIASGGTIAGGGAASGGGATGGGGTASSGGGAVARGGTASSGGGATGGGGASSGGGATARGGTAAGGGASSGGKGSCPLDLVGFATLNGGTTGGGDATPTIVTSQAELKSCAAATEPRVCRVQGTLTFSPFEEIGVRSNKTIIGIGANAEIVMGGFFVGANVRNVIIRNLTIRDSYVEGQDEPTGDAGGDRDGVQMDTASQVWIDHCRFARLGDGLIDSRHDTTFETVSWNILENHNKTFGIGWTTNVTAEITIHHNWIRNTVQRNPSTDNVLRAHLFNNFLQNVTSYGNYARGGTNMVLENSVFDQVKDPYYYDTGSLVAAGNIVRSSTGQQEASGTTSSFFDPGTFYSYTLDPASEVEALLARCAGPRAELGQ